MARVVIFGLRDFASLAHYYLKHDGPHEVVAFTAHREYLEGRHTFEGLPVVPFEDAAAAYPPGQFSFFAPMSHRRMNRLREEVVAQAKAMGYSLLSYVSSKATTFPDLHIGENCFVLEDTTIQPFVRIGDNVMIWSGSHVGHHSTIGDHVFVAPRVVLSGHCTIETHAFLGVNATIRNGLTIAQGSLIAMGACVTRDTEEWGVYKGNPARKSAEPSHRIDF